jgi:hypothetical protein
VAKRNNKQTKQAPEQAAPETTNEATTEAVLVRPAKRKAETLRKYRATYERYQTASGELSLDNGDAVAQLLRATRLEVVLAAADVVAKKPAGFHAERYAARNNGAKRMNAGNVLRGAVKRGDATEEEVRAAVRACANTVAE